MDWTRVFAAWPVPGPWSLRPVDLGANNYTRIVDTPAGAYVLRIYRNAFDPSYFRYEHAVLNRLHRLGLPFAVPAPVPARSGDTLVRVPWEGGEALAALFPFIPGQRPDPANLAQVRAAGRALGELTLALARIGDEVGPGSQPPCGDLHGTHPLVPDPLALPRELPLDPGERDRLTRLFAGLLERVPALYQALPWQVTHGDFAPSNVLIQEDRVTGVLDFEFVAGDLRAIDVAIGLSFFAGEAWRREQGWEQVEAFSGGYATRVRLEPAEVEALPVLLRLREACVVIHVAGRHRQGLEPQDNVRGRVRRALWLDEWLRAHGAELVERVGRCFEAPPSVASRASS